VRFVSVCSGIEAASVAWHPLGWEPVLFAEIAKFPSQVLAHHYPGVPNVGDFTSIGARSDVDLLVGGTPCQSFSVAGLRGGLQDERGNLALEYCRLADRLRPRWLVWENVPGVLSSNGGRDFGSILGALVNLGYGFAYRVLDAQYFGVPQRRRRVFVVGHLGDWRRAAAVLFEPASLRGDLAKGGTSRKALAGNAAVGVGGSVAHTLRGEGFDASEDGTGRGTPVVAFDTTQITSATNRSRPEPGDPSPTLARVGSGLDIASPPAVAHCLAACAAKGGDPTTDNYTVQDYRVRRLTPRECERLQGFPDDYTAIPGASDSARYKALGNSMAVPVMRWIGRRIQRVESL
jgi:DNA (cytosine-5)-methyltransferase 1